MHVKKSYSLTKTAFFDSGKHVAWLVAYTVLMAVHYQYTALHWFSIPWLPLSLIGPAVTFYVGSKNNQAYDRLWEARTIWGGIVNSSRIWGASALVRAPGSVCYHWPHCFRGMRWPGN